MYTRLFLQLLTKTMTILRNHLSSLGFLHRVRSAPQPFKNGSDWGNYHGADFTSKCLVEFEQGAPVGFQFLAIFEV